MRVAIDAGPLYGHRTGVGVATAGMVDALAERADTELRPYLVSSRSTPEAGHHKLPLPGIIASHLWSRGNWPRADRWLGDVDVVHGTNYVAPPSKIPTIISVYDCWFLQHPELANPLVRRAGNSLRRSVADGAWVHTTSQATSAQARDLLGTDRVETIYLGPPPVPAHETAPVPDGYQHLNGRRFIAAIGTEERRKGLPLLVEAYGRLASGDGELHLVIAGAPGDDSDQIVAAIDVLDADARSRVNRLGVVDAATKSWLLRHASVLAYPSLDEGFGFPVLEAHAAGTPVVASRVGSIPEVAGSAARLVDDPSRSPDTFAAALADVLSGTGRLTMIQAGYRNLARFDWATTAQRLTELYTRALENR